MGQLWAYRSVLLRTLLIAMAIQGVTPDLYDLSSPGLFDRLHLLLFGAPVSETAVLADGRLDYRASAVVSPFEPPAAGDEDQEDTSDEVYAPTRFGGYDLLRRNSTHPPRPAHQAAVPFGRSTRPVRFGSPSPCGEGALIHSLCRMTC